MDFHGSSPTWFLLLDTLVILNFNHTVSQITQLDNMQYLSEQLV